MDVIIDFVKKRGIEPIILYMNTFVYFLLFIIIILFYFHFIEQFKRGEDLEIYELDYTNNAMLQEMSKKRQPIVFDFSPILSSYHFLNTLSLDTLAIKMGKDDVCVKDVWDYWNVEEGGDALSKQASPMGLQTAMTLMTTDSKAHYISYGNQEFIRNGILDEYFPSFHEYIRPSFTLVSRPDICFGSRNATMPLTYHTDFELFIFVPSTVGKIRVKMIPYKYTKYLHLRKDYDQYEFYSPVNIWEPQEQYRNDVEKTQILDFDVDGGHMLIIPPYWWYSVQFIGEECFYYSMTYITAMNVLANSVDYTKYYLEQYSSRGEKTVRTLDVSQARSGENGDNGKSEKEEVKTAEPTVIASID